jgi:hypothetical protein
MEMPKAFSVASWNVRHFKSEPTRVSRVVAFLQAQNPDVLALYEVEGKDIFTELTAELPGYTFQITEGPQTQEILLGVKPNLSGFITQKVAFKSGVALLRPGALLTVTVDGSHYALLFLHTASGADPRGLGLRDDMLRRALDFKATLDKAPGANGDANYLFLGDLNTMGMKYRYAREHDIPAPDEIAKTAEAATRKGMRLLTKTSSVTWWGGGSLPPSQLDQVVASAGLNFKQFQGADVSVRGWPTLATQAEQRSWIKDHSDHALLYFEVQKV